MSQSMLHWKFNVTSYTMQYYNAREFPIPVT